MNTAVMRNSVADNASITEHRLGNVISDLPSLTDPIRLDANKALQGFLLEGHVDGDAASLTMSAVLATEVFQRKAEAKGSKLETRQELQRASGSILGDGTLSRQFALSLIPAALAISNESNQSINRAAASAITSKIKAQQEPTRLSKEVVYSLVQLASQEMNDIDLHIVTLLAKSLGVDSCSNEAVAQATACTVRRVLHLDRGDNVSVSSSDEPDKTDVAAALALAAQLGPWKELDPAQIIEATIPFDLWHAAEHVCNSAVEQGEESIAVAASQALIDAALVHKTFRRADAYATKFYTTGGASRFLESRFLHACDTISKVIRKGALPIIEKQVERVDQSVAKVEGDGTVVSNDAMLELTTSTETASKDIRIFALQQLEESGNIDAAHRLATTWKMDYVYDPAVLEAARAARRAKYLQWQDVFPKATIPELLSTPESLKEAFPEFLRSSGNKIFGFDVEWEDDVAGASVLQIATTDTVLLIDILSLSKSAAGGEALQDNVGKLFASTESALVGFCCRQDLSKLRSSPYCDPKRHWFGEAINVIDLQVMVGTVEPSLRRLGLSRCCERYLSKPLDKSEQCSRWSNRPLTVEQCVYAALDAHACAAIYEQITLNANEKEAFKRPRIGSG